MWESGGIIQSTAQEPSISKEGNIYLFLLGDRIFLYGEKMKVKDHWRLLVQSMQKLLYL